MSEKFCLEGEFWILVLQVGGFSLQLNEDHWQWEGLGENGNADKGIALTDGEHTFMDLRGKIFRRML